MQQSQQPIPDFQEDNYSSGNSGTYGEQQQEFIREILDVKVVIEEFEHRVLRGEYEYTDVNTGETGWKKFDPNAPAIINEVGIREIVGRLMGYGNKITRLSYYDDEEIYKNMFYFDMSLTELISKRAGYWELDIETAKAIKDASIELVQSILFSARNGFTAINIRTQYSKQDINRNDPKESGKSFLGIGLGGKR